VPARPAAWLASRAAITPPPTNVAALAIPDSKRSAASAASARTAAWAASSSAVAAAPARKTGRTPKRRIVAGSASAPTR
jgi:hypothetical protein